MSKTQVRLIAICDYKSPLGRIKYGIFTALKVRVLRCDLLSYDTVWQRDREVPDGCTASSCQTAARCNGAEGNSRSTSSFSMLQVIAGLRCYSVLRRAPCIHRLYFQPFAGWYRRFNMETSTEWLITNGAPNQEENPPFLTVSCDIKIIVKCRACCN